MQSEGEELEGIFDANEFQRALERFNLVTQSPCVPRAPVGERLEPRNSFEVHLEKIGIELHCSDDDKISTYISKYLVGKLWQQLWDITDLGLIE